MKKTKTKLSWPEAESREVQTVSSVTLRKERRSSAQRPRQREGAPYRLRVEARDYRGEESFGPATPQFLAEVFAVPESGLFNASGGGRPGKAPGKESGPVRPRDRTRVQ